MICPSRNFRRRCGFPRVSSNLPTIEHYEYLQSLGEGASGYVYLCRDRDQECALKIFKGLGIDRARLGRAFAAMDEAPEHLHVVRARNHDLDFRPSFCAWPVFPKTLDTLVGRIAPDEAWAVLRQIISGMAHLHRHGVAHCSLGPGNVMLSANGQPAIVDYGQGWVGGVHHYERARSFLFAAPEQLENPLECGNEKAFRWDVFAFGMTAYYLIEGRLPRAHELLVGDEGVIRPKHGPADIAARMRTDEDIRWSADWETIGEPQRAMVERCLAPDPHERFVDLRDLESVLFCLENEEARAAEVAEWESECAEWKTRHEGEVLRRSRWRKYFTAAAAVLVCSLLWNLINGWREMGLRKQHQNRVELIQAEAAATVEQALLVQSEVEAYSNQLEVQLTQSRENVEYLAQFLFPDGIGSVPSRADIQMLRAMARHFAIVYAGTNDEPTLSPQACRAARMAARLERALGNNKEALVYARRASEISQNGDGGELAAAQVLYGEVLLDHGDGEMARPLLRGAVERLRSATGSGGSMDTTLMVRGLCQLGRAEAFGGDGEQALASYREAMQVLEDFEPQSDSTKFLRAQCHEEAARLMLAGGQQGAALEAILIASGELSELARNYPARQNYRYYLGQCYETLGGAVYEIKADGSAALEAMNEARQLYEGLVDESPRYAPYREALAAHLFRRAKIERDTGAGDVALESLDRSRECLENLVKDGARTAHLWLAANHASRSELFTDQKNDGAALDSARVALMCFRRAPNEPVGFDVSAIDGHLLRADVCGTLGRQFFADGDTETARELFIESREIWSRLGPNALEDSRIDQGLEWSKHWLRQIEMAEVENAEATEIPNKKRESEFAEDREPKGDSTICEIDEE